ncbi:beta-1:4-mannosyltransferase egh-like protein [Leptotrombidium deliense]|uniref:Beta-1:4-mannosyltransferase egh-like protein n=1 Tax=Leptotrombidium deliense TaxID=299467 RepID=A0A443SKD0_9ACAR|nr:beta-1:4-mannosyltransferase egh-like protein [Leptotrombidium deliense]
MRRIIKLNSSTKHALHCCLLFTLILVSIVQLVATNEKDQFDFDPFNSYGTIPTYILYFMRVLALLSLPQVICNFCGLTFFNAFPEKVTLKSSPLLSPFVCVRVVTRGDFPDLVKKNVTRNMNTLIDVGLENFIVEIVTDKSLDISKHPRIRELVVPKDYKTKTGALFKARALQYALEDEVNILGDNDWIVHLDEETILTDNCVRGIINFVMHGKHEFGQGLVTYANEEIVNWLTTLADSFRVTDDMGKLRFQFYIFHRPLFGWKGSYVVSKASAERNVTFDHGLDGSIAEDCYFSMIAYSKGYTFEFIEGEMWEKSPFTIRDFIQQRKRWMQGIYLVVHSPKIPIINKLFLAVSLYSWITVPLSTSNFFLTYLCPLPKDSFVMFNCLVAFVGAVNIYMYIFGVLKSFTLVRIGPIKFLLCVAGALLMIPVNLVFENIAIIWGIVSNKHKFYVVQKQISSSPSQVV